MEEKCIFCAIANKQIPSKVVYEDDNFMAFLDIRPLNKGHVLVVTKKHYRWVYDVENFGSFWEVAKKIALAQLKALGAVTVQFMTAGFAVPHAHIHIVPRFENDGHGEYLVQANVKEFSEQEMEETAENIKNAIHVEQPKIEEKAEEEPKEEVKRDVEWIKREMQLT